MKRAKNWLTESECQRIFEIDLISDRDLMIVGLLYFCALRVSELCHLRTGDVLVAEKRLIIRKSKNEPNPVAVPIYGQLLELVLDYIKTNRRKNDDFLIPSRSKYGINRKSVYRILQRLCKAANIDKHISPHTFRRSRATHLLDKGMRITRVSQLLRHKKITTTQEYLKMSTQGLLEEMEKFDGVKCEED